MRATLRGANPLHLLAVVDHATSIVLAQVNVDAKTNEIPCLKTVLNQITDLKDVLVTADALHCQTTHITYLLGRCSGTPSRGRRSAGWRGRRRCTRWRPSCRLHCVNLW